MQPWMVKALAVLAIVGVAIAIWRLTARDDDPMTRTGALYDALIDADVDGTDRDVSDVVTPFVPSDAPFAKRRTTLEKNGFACQTNGVEGQGGSSLGCIRPIPDTDFCRGFVYSSHQLPNGRFRATALYFDHTERRNTGACRANQETYDTFRSG